MESETEDKGVGASVAGKRETDTCKPFLFVQAQLLSLVTLDAAILQKVGITLPLAPRAVGPGWKTNIDSHKDSPEPPKCQESGSWVKRGESGPCL